MHADRLLIRSTNRPPGRPRAYDDEKYYIQARILDAGEIALAQAFFFYEHAADIEPG